MAENPRTTPGLHLALTIAGSDSSGGAGIQADLKTFTVMNVFGAAVITVLTAQNTTGVKAMQLVDPEFVEKQIDAVAGDMEIHATKTGLLGSAATVRIVAKAIDRASLFPLVVDPVIITKAGSRIADDDAVAAMKKELLPLASVVTPNRAEAAALLGLSGPIDDIARGADAAVQICKRFGAKACIVKGFKRDNEHEGDAVDLFYDGHDVQEVVSAWRPTENTHGAGCVFAAAITAALADDASLPDAAAQAKEVVSEAIRQTTGFGAGRGPVNPMAYLKVK